MELIPDHLSEEVQIELENEAQIGLDRLLGLIQALPDKYRLCFNLYVLDGYSHKEIANMLDISEGTSKSNVSRARNILKVEIETSIHNKEQTPCSGERI